MDKDFLNFLNTSSGRLCIFLFAGLGYCFIYKGGQVEALGVKVNIPCNERQNLLVSSASGE
ncbi:MAG: hypothetical protein ACLTXX_06520 [Streptococcus salivarius]